MKKSASTAVIIAALLAATWPASAQDAPARTAGAQPERPRFIAKGQRLSQSEAAALAAKEQQAANRVWPGEGGMSKSAKVWIAVGVVFVVGVTIFVASLSGHREVTINQPIGFNG